MQLVCFCLSELFLAAEDALAPGIDKGIQVQFQPVEKVDNRFLRQHPQLMLIYDAEGLWLSANGMKMQPRWQDEIRRLRQANPRNELLARACQPASTAGEPVRQVLDCTAGLGHDGLLLAHLGAQVTLVERHPVLWLLLQQQLKQARQHPFLAASANRMQLVYADAVGYLTTLRDSLNSPQPGLERPDVVYLDPMFPQQNDPQPAKKSVKQPAVKKQMQILHALFEHDLDRDRGDALLSLARQLSHRVIVKRPRHAVYLDGQQPHHQWLGDACRFDGYFNMADPKNSATE